MVTNSNYSGLGSTPLHLAAKGGSLDCVRELLAWGADRLQRDSSGYGENSEILTDVCDPAYFKEAFLTHTY